MSARAKSPPAATRPAPQARSGARHPPLGGGAAATHPADVAVTLSALLSVCCTYAHGERTLLGRHTTNLTVFADATGARTRALRIGIRTAAAALVAGAVLVLITLLTGVPMP